MKKAKLLSLILAMMIAPVLDGFASGGDAYAWFYLLKHKKGYRNSPEIIQDTLIKNQINLE
ncbi:MAG: hypothetical protein ACQESX_07985 [Bacteroidota bacterium]